MFGRERKRANREPVLSCEAYLDGRYLEHLNAKGVRLPAWAWMNLLAHGTEAELEAARRRRTDGAYWHYITWHHARSYLAGEVLDAAANIGSLATLQQEVLVPMELNLLEHGDGKELSPNDWVSQVLSSLSKRQRIEKHRNELDH